MRIVPVRRFRVKTTVLDMAVLGFADPKPNSVIVIARRDLLFLQRMFRNFDKGRKVDYSAFKRLVKRTLDELAQGTNSRDRRTSIRNHH